MPGHFTELPFDFAGKVYGSAMPYSREFDPFSVLFERFQQANIDVVVMMARDDEALREAGRDLRQLYAAQGWKVIYIPTPDFSVPPLEDLKRGLDLAQAELAAGKNVVIHCLGGRGRTGLFAACLARRVWALSAAEAIAWVRKYIPGAVERPSQEEMIASIIPESRSP
jgi:protein-tyrosine phosphatase